MKTPDSTKEAVWAKIGQLCMVWASLDYTANALITAILRCSDEQTSCIVTRLDPLSARTALLKTLIYTAPASPRWKELCNEVFLYIDNHLCPARNRLVHDAWRFDEATPVQLDRRAKVGKPQAREAPKLNCEIRRNVTPEIIDELITSVTQCAVALMGAATELDLLAEDPAYSPKSTILEIVYQEMIVPNRIDRPRGPSAAKQVPA